jgi:hypothetical protein
MYDKGSVRIDATRIRYVAAWRPCYMNHKLVKKPMKTEEPTPVENVGTSSWGTPLM